MGSTRSTATPWPERCSVSKPIWINGWDDGPPSLLRARTTTSPRCKALLAEEFDLAQGSLALALPALPSASSSCFAASLSRRWTRLWRRCRTWKQQLAPIPTQLQAPSCKLEACQEQNDISPPQRTSARTQYCLQSPSRQLPQQASETAAASGGTYDAKGNTSLRHPPFGIKA